jgi:hypothetical protein
MTTYTRDDQLAVQPESNFGGRIETSGAYIGRLTLAKERTARTGTKGIEFTFEADDGRVARYLTLWVARANGEKIEYPYSLLSALMACLDVKQIDSTSATVDEWNPASGMREPGEAQVYPDLMNKPIGVLLQREEREWEGKTYVSMKIVQFFDPRDRSTPAEIMSGNRAGQAIEKMVSNLRETVVRADAPPTGAAPVGAGSGSFAEIDDDDVPF